jgi:hypothetical protein
MQPTRQRPISVTIMGVLMVVVGAVGMARYAYAAKPWHSLPTDMVEASLVSLIALVSGVLILRGSNWGRWLTLLWMSFHVVISALHSVQQAVVHGLLLGLFAYLLFRLEARTYFSASG